MNNTNRPTELAHRHRWHHRFTKPIARYLVTQSPPLVMLKGMGLSLFFAFLAYLSRENLGQITFFVIDVIYFLNEMLQWAGTVIWVTTLLALVSSLALRRGIKGKH